MDILLNKSNVIVDFGVITEEGVFVLVDDNRYMKHAHIIKYNQDENLVFEIQKHKLVDGVIVDNEKYVEEI
jgi:hypothetical protein